MKIRIGDNTIVEAEELLYAELEESTIIIRFKNNWETREFFNNELEATYVFNNLTSHLNVVDVRPSPKKETATIDERKERAFDIFWNLYDHKKSLTKAKTAFMNLSLNEMGEAVRKVKAYVESTPNKRYRKNPTTWINQKGWSDDLRVVDIKKENRYVKPNYITDER